MEISRISQESKLNSYNSNSGNTTKQKVNSDVIIQTGVKTLDEKLPDGNNRENADFSQKDLKDAIDICDKFLARHKTHIEFENHEVFTRDTMIKIVDEKSGNVIVEVPPKKILDMVAKMCEMVGVLVDKKA
jgi:flagellar protein FlaG